MDKLFLTEGQFSIFCFCLLAGLLAGALYTAAEIIRAVLGGGKLSVIVTDLGWGLSASGVAVWAGLRFASGEIRLYWILSLVLGTTLYLLLLHHPIAKKITAFLEKRKARRLEKEEHRLWCAGCGKAFPDRPAETDKPTAKPCLRARRLNRFPCFGRCIKSVERKK